MQNIVDTIREIAVMMHRDLVECGATIAKFATVQNRTIRKIRVVQNQGN